MLEGHDDLGFEAAGDGRRSQRTAHRVDQQRDIRAPQADIGQHALVERHQAAIGRALTSPITDLATDVSQQRKGEPLAFPTDRLVRHAVDVRRAETDVGEHPLVQHSQLAGNLPASVRPQENIAQPLALDAVGIDQAGSDRGRHFRIGRDRIVVVCEAIHLNSFLLRPPTHCRRPWRVAI